MELNFDLNLVSAYTDVASKLVSLLAAETSRGLDETSGAVVIAHGASVAEDSILDSISHRYEFVVVTVSALVAGDGVEAGLTFSSAGLAGGWGGS